MQLAVEKHNSLMAEAQDGRGESGPLLSNGENGVRIFAVTSSLSPVQALTGTFSACILSPKRRDVRSRNSSWIRSMPGGTVWKALLAFRLKAS